MSGRRYGFFRCSDCGANWESAYVFCVEGSNTVSVVKLHLPKQGSSATPFSICLKFLVMYKRKNARKNSEYVRKELAENTLQDLCLGLWSRWDTTDECLHRKFYIIALKVI